MTPDDFEAVIQTNLNAVFYMTKAVLRPMLRQKFGRIVTIGSIVGSMGNPGQANYCAAKAGFVQVMKLLLDQGADMEATDQQGETPLFDAIRSTIKKVENKRAAITLLITAGANINQPNHKGQTVWQVAKRVRSIDAAEIL